VPFTSLLTVGVVGFVSYIYITVYVPALIELNQATKAYIVGSIFVIFPTLIFWVLIRIVCGDPGHVTTKLIDKILADNDISRS